MRVALVVGDEQTIHRVNVGIGNGPSWVSFVLQRAAAFLLSDQATGTLLKRAAESYTLRRNLLIGELASRGIAASGASGLNVWIPTDREHAAVEAARQAGYAIRSGTPYQLTAERAVRVTISTLRDHDIVAVAAAIGAAHQTHAVGAPV